MKKKKIVIALGHDALGTTLPEQHEATKHTAKAVADFIRDDYEVVITHSNGPQVGMIHTAMSEFCRIYPEYTATPTAVCSAMSQGYIGYDLQNAIRTELLGRGIYKTVSTILTQVVVDPYAEVYVDDGYWKARQGGNGVAYAQKSVVSFTPCVTEEKIKR